MTLILNLLLALIINFLATCTSPIHENISNSPKFCVVTEYPYSLTSNFISLDFSFNHAITSSPCPFSTPNVSESLMYEKLLSDIYDLIAFVINSLSINFIFWAVFFTSSGVMVFSKVR